VAAVVIRDVEFNDVVVPAGGC